MADPGPHDPPSGASYDQVRGLLLVELLSLLFAATLFVSGLLLSGVTTRIDNAIYDFALSLRRHAAPKDVVIVAIDFPSMEKNGRWPWPRSIQADLIRNITREQPKAVFCDILFVAPGARADDQKVNEAMKLAPVYLPEVLEPPGGGHAGYLSRPTPEIASAAAGFGLAGATPDMDGIVRRSYLQQGYEGALLPEVMSVMLGAAPAQHAAAEDFSTPAVSRRAVTRTGEFLIPYAGPPGHFAQVSASDVLEGALPEGYFRDKYVLVGATAPGLLDNYPTPVSSADGMPNIEVEANIFDALRRHDLVKVMPMWGQLFVAMWMVWILFLFLLRFRPSQMAVQGPVGTVLALVLSGGVLIVFGLWIPPTPVLITRTLVQIIWSTRRLQAASDYLATELADLQSRAGGALLPGAKPLSFPLGDSVARQMMLIDQTKERIRELRRFVVDIMGTFPDPVLIVNPRSRIITANEAAVQLGRKLDLPVEAGARVQPILEALEAAAGGKDKLWPPAIGPNAPAPRGLAPGGRVLEARYTPISGEGGDVRGWTIHLVDVTELVSIMRQREEAMQLFTHDMRSPQSAILAALEHKEFKALPAALREGIEKNALRTISLADGFVRLAQAEAAEYAFEPIDLFHLLSDAADALWTIAEAASVRIVVEDPGREFVISADRGLMARALINLLDNAIKFSPPGKRITCSLRETWTHNEPAVACSIADQAAGMSREQQESLFKRFARSPLTGDQGSRRALRASGIGLGLAVVHTVITRHQGQIDCYSEVGKGTVFTITLPLCDEDTLDAESLALDRDEDDDDD